MTNQELFEDLKQLLVTTVAQSESRLSVQIYGIESRLGSLESEMRNGFEGVGKAISNINDRLDKLYGVISASSLKSEAWLPALGNCRRAGDLGFWA